MNRTTNLLLRIFLIIITFGIAAYVLISFKIWGHDWQQYLFMVNRWPELIFVLAVVIAISMAIEMLLKWQIRELAKPERRMQRDRRRPRRV